ncbi:glycosyltransferase family 2 protein [Porticoccus sp. W117]|uniref:glycosyltransferase family 2 protein n=1 Tax=Porticoccus sp. W117 TaxID=3054777 RepID=UPI002595D8ED|nr:glycosyltransferase family 2 protein [Porticoccus sp. W117]MDM3871303.1 glycosyltransferase family 2 protein [Porticoccus sp. W117]
MFQQKSVAVVIPAYNEADAIGAVVSDLLRLENSNGLPLVDDIVVCDNGSTDNTAAIARDAGARVVCEERPGYGAACQAAITALANPDIVVFVDGDHSVCAEEIPLLLVPLENSDLVIGSRVLGRCEKGALTPPQRFGNWLASALIRLFWKAPVTDLGPFRAINCQALQYLNMEDMAFGWTVEMQVKAAIQGFEVVEVPVTTRKRIGKSKISGTLKGVIGAARGILQTIFSLWWRQRRSNLQARTVSH